MNTCVACRTLILENLNYNNQNFNNHIVKIILKVSPLANFWPSFGNLLQTLSVTLSLQRKYWPSALVKVNLCHIILKVSAQCTFFFQVWSFILTSVKNILSIYAKIHVFQNFPTFCYVDRRSRSTYVISFKRSQHGLTSGQVSKRYCQWCWYS